MKYPLRTWIFLVVMLLPSLFAATTYAQSPGVPTNNYNGTGDVGSGTNQNQTGGQYPSCLGIGACSDQQYQQINSFNQSVNPFAPTPTGSKTLTPTPKAGQTQKNPLLSAQQQNNPALQAMMQQLQRLCNQNSLLNPLLGRQNTPQNQNIICQQGIPGQNGLNGALQYLQQNPQQQPNQQNAIRNGSGGSGLTNGQNTTNPNGTIPIGNAYQNYINNPANQNGSSPTQRGNQIQQQFNQNTGKNGQSSTNANQQNANGSNRTIYFQDTQNPLSFIGYNLSNPTDFAAAAQKAVELKLVNSIEEFNSLYATPGTSNNNAQSNQPAQNQNGNQNANQTPPSNGQQPGQTSQQPTNNQSTDTSSGTRFQGTVTLGNDTFDLGTREGLAGFASYFQLNLTQSNTPGLTPLGNIDSSLASLQNAGQSIAAYLSGTDRGIAQNSSGYNTSLAIYGDLSSLAQQLREGSYKVPGDDNGTRASAIADLLTNTVLPGMQQNIADFAQNPGVNGADFNQMLIGRSQGELATAQQRLQNENTDEANQAVSTAQSLVNGYGLMAQLIAARDDAVANGDMDRAVSINNYIANTNNAIATLDIARNPDDIATSQGTLDGIIQEVTTNGILGGNALEGSPSNAGLLDAMVAADRAPISLLGLRTERPPAEQPTLESPNEVGSGQPSSDSWWSGVRDDLASGAQQLLGIDLSNPDSEVPDTSGNIFPDNSFAGVDLGTYGADGGFGGGGDTGGGSGE